MNKLFVYLFLFISISLSNAENVLAHELGAGSSAVLSKNITQEATDNRTRVLREFLKKYDSPLAPFASDFVETADEYNLDWKLVAAISGLESTFGKQIPYNSYNGWGWGIFGDNVIYFSSWEEGIKTVSQGLRENYINKWGAKDIYQIGRLYAASPTWAQRVEYFMSKIEEYRNLNLASLSISL